MKEERETLGNNVIPLNYSIRIEPDFKTFKYKGSEVISIDIKKGAKSISLNAIEIKVKKASLAQNGKEYPARVKMDERRQLLTLAFKSPFQGKAQLIVEFAGSCDDSLRGLYRSKYKQGKTERYILTTQFEPADARKAFPCFDEPELKATFDLSLVIDKDMEAISNMPVKSSRKAGKRKKELAFRTTPRMSTYLLYIGIGNFERVSTNYRGIRLSAVTVPGKAKDTRMALGYCKSFLEFYESYFGIKFPLPKMDILAIPDFSAGAMENWGAITFREVELLGNEKTTSIVFKQRRAEVIAHELAHQWFGDLVTMKWWDDLWLNESFATFMAGKAVESVFPNWEYGLQDQVSNLSTAFGADQYISTHPINAKVRNPGQINEIFDEISYEKGGSVLMMLEDYVGKENFRAGLKRYLSRHSYSNATKDDLWNAIGEVSGKKGIGRFAEVAKGWIDKAGYPIITVSETKDGIELKQRRFSMLESNLNGIWPIPVNYVIDGSRQAPVLFDREKSSVKAQFQGYVKLNYGQKGFYRVSYPENMLNALGSAISEKRIDPLDAWGVERDLFALAMSSRIKLEGYLDFVERYCMDQEYPLDSGVSAHLSGLNSMLEGSKKFGKRVRQLNLEYHKALLGKLGWEEKPDERNVTTLLRAGTITELGMAGDSTVMSRANEMFADYRKTGKRIEKNIRGAIFRTIAYRGNLETYNEFIRLFKAETAPDEQRRFMIAIGSFKDESIARRALDFSMSKDVRLQDSCFLPMYVVLTDTGKRIIWEWTKKNWKGFMKRYSPGVHMLDHFVENLAGTDNRKARDEISEFFSRKENSRDDMKKALKQTLESIDILIRFKEFNNA